MGKTNKEWTVCDKGNVYSNDFTHDVMLVVNGDFENLAQKREYAKKLAGMLNGQVNLDSSSRVVEGTDLYEVVGVAEVQSRGIPVRATSPTDALLSKGHGIHVTPHLCAECGYDQQVSEFSRYEVRNLGTGVVTTVTSEEFEDSTKEVQ